MSKGSDITSGKNIEMPSVEDKVCEEDQYWDGFLSTGHVGDIILPHPMELFVFHVSETKGTFGDKTSFGPVGHDITLE